MSKYFVFASLIILISGCAATPYQPMSTSTKPVGGYLDKKVGPNEYHLQYSGNGFSKIETIITYWNQRANELCPKGFDLLDQDKKIVKSYPVTNLYIAPGLVVPHVSKIEVPYVQGSIKCKT